MGSKIEKAGENFFRPVNKAVKRSGLAGILPYASMALPFLGLPGGAFTRYLLPQLMTSASSVAEGGKLNPLRNLLTAGSSYLAGPTANRPGGADPFDLKANVMDNPSRANYLKSGVDPTMFQKFKTGIDTLGDKAKNYAQSGSILGEAEAGTLAEFTQPAKTVGTLVAADRSLNAYEAAKQAEKDYKNSNSDGGYDSAQYTTYLKSYLSNAGYTQDEIDDYMANRPSYNMGGRVDFGDGGTSNRENSGIIEMEMIDPETGQKKQFFGSLYDEDIMSGILNNSIIPLESHPLLEGMKKGGRVGYNVGGDVQGLTGDQLRLLYKESLGKGYDSTFEDFISDFGNVPEDFMSMRGPDEYEDLGSDILEINTDDENDQGRSFAGGPDEYEDLGSDILEINDDYENDQGRSFAGGPKSLLDPKEMQVASNSDNFDVKSFIEGLRKFPSSDSDEAYTEEFIRTMRNGAGIASLKMGGMPSMEMDYRGGGFIPVGSKEKADDVPARLSKNEFVMTADAVRAAGGGSVNKGAQKMYQLMNQLESKV